MTSAYASSILRKTLCHASRSKKPQNQTKRADFPKKGNLQKPKPFSFMLILLALLAMMAIAPAMWAQNSDQYPYPANVNDLPEWQGENNGKFKITADSTKINSTVDVHSDGGTPRVLVLYPVGTPVVVKETTNAELFKVRDKGELHIIGRVGDTLKIYGNCGNGTATNPTPIPTRTNYQGSCILSIGTASLNPKIWLKYVEFYGFVTHTSINNNDGGNTGQGGIVTMGTSASSVVGACRMKHVTFKNSYGGPVVTNHNKGYGRIISFVSGTWTVTLDNVKIHDCLISEYLHGGHESIGGMGSVIRSQGQVGGSLTMTNCEAYNNTYRDLSGSENNSILDYKNMNQIKSKPLSGQGGVVNWRSGRQNNSGGNAFVSIQDCHFHHNSARYGGAVATCAFINMDRTEICYNEAERGGGVYFYTYNGTDAPYDGHGFRATFEGGVNIHHNSASQYGGGAYLTFDASDDVGFNPSQQAISPEFSLNINEGSTIHHNKAPKGAGIALMDGCPYSHYNNRDGHKKWSLEYQRTVNLNGGKIYDNYAQGTEGDEMAGGGIYIEKYEYPSNHQFYSDYAAATNPTTAAQNNSGTINVHLLSGEVYNNSAGNDTIPGPGYGGGVYIASKFTNPDIVSTLNVNIGEDGKTFQMYKNQAYTDGGGVYVWYDREDNRKNNGTVTVNGGTIGRKKPVTDEIEGNKALTRNGGGICVMGGTVVVNGGDIEYNTAAELGGGVYVSVPNKESTTTIQGGANISRNTANGGGGVYVDKGLLTVDGPVFSLGDYGQDQANNDDTHTRITKNTALDGNGGGINAGNGTVDITNALIYNNTAIGTVSKGRGGGVYLDGGFINIVSSKILYNTAQTNGGGIDDHSGDIEIYGGDISHNTATNGRGGGVYTNAGDIRIWPSALYNNPASAPSLNDCKNTGTVFSYNTAGTNGGGLNTHIGRLDVRYAKVHHNVAGHNYTTIGTQGGSGGGMFCEGPHADLSGYTVRLLHTLLNYNKAYGNGGSDDNLTGRGGGLYLKYGSIFAEHCNILGNKADINGGGLDNHDGELRVYGSIIGKSLEETMPEDCKTEDDDENGNRAISGRGGGLYTDKGNLVVGPCDSYGFVESKASRICNNTAYINGGGINNHEGDITIHGDRINNNTAVTGDGGGVYINSGQIYMYGGQINNNKADNGKGGGVYGGGGTFNIMEREAHPILEILDVEGITTSGFTVHFHHVDRGNAMKEDAKNKEYGIAFSVNPYPSDLGENVDWTGHWQDVTTVKVGPTNGTPIPTAPHTYNQNEGCSRFVASGLTSGKTYYVVAYGKYTYDEKDYFDASPAVAVKTRGNEPVVVAGVAFDVTANSASVNAKLFYNGIGEVTVTSKGFQLSTDGGNTWGPQRESLSVGDVFSYTFEGLSANTSYMARAYATNSAGHTGYSEGIIQFTTSSGSKAMDAAGKLPRSVYPEVEKNPFFQELTPLQQAVLANTPEEDTTTRRSRNGRPSDEEPVNIPQINNNTATYGGGVCIDKQGARLIFSGKRGEIGEDGIGQINYNYASEAGGGIYIGKESADEYAKMQMMGKCEVNDNHVPAGKHGGGIYLDGRLYVGDKDTDLIGTHGLKVDNNWAVDGAGAGLPVGFSANGKLNNVFLTRYDYEYNENETEVGDNNVSVITLLSDISGYAGPGNTNPYSSIGFSVIKGFCPVIATSEYFSKTVGNEEIDGNFNLHDYIPTGETQHVSSEQWLRNLMIMSGVDEGIGTADALIGAVFEDSESYVAVHTQTDIAPFRSKFIYLWGCWTHPVVKEDPEKDTGPEGDPDQSMVGTGKHYKITKDANGILTWKIYSPEGLSWFSSYVNGLNVFDERIGGDDKHDKWNKDINPYAKAKIMNDLDMSAYLWVPIGAVKYFFINSIGTNQGSLFVDSETPLTIESHEYNDNHKYKGSFDGQGHIITGLQGLYLTGIRKFGLFGYLDEGAEVKNTFVDESHFVSDDKTVIYSAGGIAGKMAGGVLSNSEARMSFDVGYSADGTAVGGLVGEIEGGDVHSSMAMPSIFGQNKGKSGTNPAFNAFQGYMGGLVGKLGDGCSLKNSFSNVEITLIDTEGASVEAAEHSRFLGGIVGENNGLIENVYVRYQGTTPPEGFGWFAGKNNYTAAGETTPAAIGTIRYCYAPRVADDESYDYADFNYIANPIENSVLELQANYGATKLESGKYGFKHRDQQMTENADNGYIVNGVFLGGLLPTLNNWVAANAGYTTWTRTMASPINDDYPVLQIADFNVVGSEDGIYMKYDDNVNDMWKEPNYNSLDPVERAGKNFKSLTAAANPNAAMYLYNTNPTAVNVSENEAVRLYIRENVGITQTDGAELHARVGVTFDNSDGTTANGGAPYDWHMFSSALQSAPMGLKYYDDIENYPIQRGYESLSGTPTADNGITEDDYKSRLYMDPPPTSWYQSDDPSSGLNNYDANKIGYFPTNTPYGSSAYGGSAGAQATFNDSFDFYCFSEQHRHWINFKRQGRPASQGVEKFFDHWYQDANDLNGQLDEGKHYNIEYPNESTFQVGKGYMMGVSAVSMLMADGMLNNGDGITTPITNNEYSINPSPYAEELRGTNLVGNPFQSYLDFDKLANDQANNGIIHNKSYYLFDADAGRYICYPATASVNQINAPQFIHPHQGFFVKTANGGNLTFKNSMRSATGGQGSTFRGDNFNYPLVNLFCYDAEGHYDVTTVEMNRPELGGGSKLKDKRNGNSLIYARLEDEDYQTLFAPTGTSTVPVRFEPSQDGVYTMRWGTLHGDFHYLHLVDNMSGADVDMLRSEEYRFEATTSDYISRFKLVFEVTDVEENPIEAEATTFAFCMGDEIIVNGTGYLEVFDVQGRRLSAKRLVDAQSSVSLPNVATGIYFLRLSDDKQVRTQKMVINY